MKRTRFRQAATRKVLTYCTFCGKGDDEVQKLIAGPNVNICDECVGKCNDILADYPGLLPGETASSPFGNVPMAVEEKLLTLQRRGCGLCGEPDTGNARVVRGTHGWVCEECMRQGMALLDEGPPASPLEKGGFDS